MPKAEISIISGPEGPSLYIGDDDGGYRLAGPKPWGGGQATHSFKIDLDELIREAEALRRQNDEELPNSTSQPPAGPKSSEEPDLRPGLEWAIARCKALQSQGFERSRNDVLIKDFQNCIGSLTKLPE